MSILVANVDPWLNYLPVRYPSSFNEFAIHTDFEAHKQKLKQARDSFMEVYGTVKDKVDNSMRLVLLTASRLDDRADCRQRATAHSAAKGYRFRDEYSRTSRLALDGSVALGPIVSFT